MLYIVFVDEQEWEKTKQDSLCGEFVGSQTEYLYHNTCQFAWK